MLAWLVSQPPLPVETAVIVWPPPRPRVTGVIAQYWLDQLGQDR
jgi:hypothetical protein